MAIFMNTDLNKYYVFPHVYDHTKFQGPTMNDTSDFLTSVPPYWYK